MLFKKLVIFGLFLSWFNPGYAYEVSGNDSEQIQQQDKKTLWFCDYDMGDWYGSSKYDEKSDEIIIRNCAWAMGYECGLRKIPKLTEFDGIKIYYSEKHPENVFINDNGNWKWKDAGCSFSDNTIVGKCLINRSSTTITKRDGKNIGTTVTEFLLCGCFNDIKSEKPVFMISEDEFSFESTYSFESKDFEITKPDNEQCDKQCTKLCEKH